MAVQNRDPHGIPVVLGIQRCPSWAHGICGWPLAFFGSSWSVYDNDVMSWQHATNGAARLNLAGHG